MVLEDFDGMCHGVIQVEISQNLDVVSVTGVFGPDDFPGVGGFVPHLLLNHCNSQNRFDNRSLPTRIRQNHSCLRAAGHPDNYTLLRSDQNGWIHLSTDGENM